MRVSLTIAWIYIAFTTPHAWTSEPELILSFHSGGSVGTGEIITEPMWPALFYLDENNEPFAPLFEDFGIPFNFPVTITNTVSAANDSDFPAFVGRLTDGVAQLLHEGPWTTSGWVLGGGGSGEPDLTGYEIDYITQIMTVNQESPGQDLNGDGIWTDWSASGFYEFYGTPIPEPATLALLGMGALALLRCRRGL